VLAILIFMIVLLPVLVPAVITAFHALAGVRRSATFSRQPIPASA
jgi:hypothetical protein